MVGSEERRQLLDDGNCVVEGVLSREMLDRLRAATDTLLAQQDPERLRRARATGSMIPVVAPDPVFADLIAWAGTLANLRRLGYPRPSFSDGWIISKPPKSPRLFWHYDWFSWEDARLYEPEPMQLFAMFYLVDTRVENGALRAIPGSHVRHNPIHDLLAEPHSRELTEASNTNAVEFAPLPDEVSLPVRAGDLVLCDARLLHAAHANESDERRTLITLWYQPDLASPRAHPGAACGEDTAAAGRLAARGPHEGATTVSPIRGQRGAIRPLPVPAEAHGYGMRYTTFRT